jgi:hypothetical protein
MSVNTKYTDKPNDQYQRADFKGLVGYFHKRYAQCYDDSATDEHRSLTSNFCVKLDDQIEQI